VEISLVYPHQLFKKQDHLTGTIFLVEDDLFFNQYNFHKNKLLLHRASMLNYAELLKEKYTVEHISADDKRANTEALFSYFASHKVKKIHYIDTTDYLLERRLKRYSKRHKIELIRYDSPDFVCSVKELEEYFSEGKKYFLAAFYEEQRKRLGILMDGKRPVGGKWSFDSENRKKMPKNVKIPDLPVFKNPFVEEAKAYVEEHFAENYGTTDHFVFPVTHRQAEKMLDVFLKEKFDQFGTYQDAIVKKEHYLFHAIISSSINTGLLTAGEVLKKAVSYAGRNKVPLNSLEGFVRQILGWREFIRAVYIREGVKQRTTNFMGFTRKIPASFYKGNTGIPPVDAVILKVQDTGYAHHIERLMIMGNFMMLCEFDPDEVYRWFMELFIDAYDWVMVPNVYGMSQFADGGLMSTKPYISSSNYILKMSDFKRGAWCDTWDALFWRFMHVHRDLIKRNPRLSMLLGTFDKMPAGKRNQLLSVAEKFLENLETPANLLF
jgi:deoxyribodipyrimidine photolyase-related protein